MNFTFLLIGYLCFGAVIAVGMRLWPKYRRKLLGLRRKKTAVVVEETEPETAIPQTSSVSDFSLNWTDIMHHEKAEELLKINGTIHGNTNYYLIAGVGTFRSFGLIQASVGNAITTPNQGFRTICSLKGSDYMILRYSQKDGVTSELKQCATFSPLGFGEDPHAFIGIENHISLVEGNTIRVHYKDSRPECNYIKHWEMPTSYASFSALSDSANIASLAERVMNAGLLETDGTNGHSPVTAKLMNGTFYVLGKDCTDRLKFRCDGNIAIRFLAVNEVANTTVHDGDKLGEVMEIIKAYPLVHLKVKNDTERGPIVFYKKENDRTEREMSLRESNMVVTIANGDRVDGEIMKISETDNENGFSVLEIQLNSFRGKAFPFVAMWRY